MSDKKPTLDSALDSIDALRRGYPPAAKTLNRVAEHIEEGRTYLLAALDHIKKIKNKTKQDEDIIASIEELIGRKP